MPEEPTPAGPSAAETVSKSKVSEADAGEVLRLREEKAKKDKELEEEKAARKKEQIRLSEMEDELHRLKKVQSAPPPAEKSKSEEGKKSWWDSGTVLDDE